VRFVSLFDKMSDCGFAFLPFSFLSFIYFLKTVIIFSFFLFFLFRLSGSKFSDISSASTVHSLHPPSPSEAGWAKDKVKKKTKNQSLAKNDVSIYDSLSEIGRNSLESAARPLSAASPSTVSSISTCENNGKVNDLDHVSKSLADEDPSLLLYGQAGRIASNLGLSRVRSMQSLNESLRAVKGHQNMPRSQRLRRRVDRKVEEEINKMRHRFGRSASAAEIGDDYGDGAWESDGDYDAAYERSMSDFDGRRSVMSLDSPPQSSSSSSIHSSSTRRLVRDDAFHQLPFQVTSSSSAKGGPPGKIPLKSSPPRRQFQSRFLQNIRNKRDCARSRAPRASSVISERRHYDAIKPRMHETPDLSWSDGELEFYNSGDLDGVIGERSSLYERQSTSSSSDYYAGTNLQRDFPRYEPGGISNDMQGGSVEDGNLSEDDWGFPDKRLPIRPRFPPRPLRSRPESQAKRGRAGGPATGDCRVLRSQSYCRDALGQDGGASRPRSLSRSSDHVTRSNYDLRPDDDKEPEVSLDALINKYLFRK